MFPSTPTFQFTAQPKTFRLTKHGIPAGVTVSDNDFDERAIHPIVRRVFTYEKGAWSLFTGPIQEGWCASPTARYNILFRLLEQCTCGHDARTMIQQIQACGDSVVKLNGISKIYVSFTTHE